MGYSGGYTLGYLLTLLTIPKSEWSYHDSHPCGLDAEQEAESSLPPFGTKASAHVLAAWSPN